MNNSHIFPPTLEVKRKVADRPFWRIIAPQSASGLKSQGESLCRVSAESPTIKLLLSNPRGQWMNPSASWQVPGYLEARASHLTVDGIDALGLAEEFGTPLYVFSERRIAENVRGLRQAVEVVHPRVKLCYASKANSNMAVLDAVRRRRWRHRSKLRRRAPQSQASRVPSGPDRPSMEFRKPMRRYATQSGTEY